MQFKTQDTTDSGTSGHQDQQHGKGKGMPRSMSRYSPALVNPPNRTSPDEGKASHSLFLERTGAWFDRWTDLVVRPTATFDRVASRPRLLPPLLFLLLSLVALYLPISPALAGRFHEIENATMTGEAAMGATEVVLVLGLIVAMAQVTMGVLIGGLVTHGAARLLGGHATAHQTATTYAMAAVPYGLRSLMTGGFSLILGSDRAPLGAALSETHLSAIILDPFTLWSALLLSIGLYRVHHLTWPRAIGITTVVVLVGRLVGAA